MSRDALDALLAAVGLALAGLAAMVLAPHPPSRLAGEGRGEGLVVRTQYGGTFGLSPAVASRFRIKRAWKDSGGTIELVFLVPPSMDPDSAVLAPEDGYAATGEARVEASPNSLYGSSVPRVELFAAMKEAVHADLKRRRVRHVLTELRGAALPAFRVRAGAPDRTTTTYLLGERAHYIVLGDPANPAVQDVVATMRELP